MIDEIMRDSAGTRRNAQLHADGRRPSEIAQHIDRSEGAIRARLHVLARR
ncbi:MAG: hypothetical protein AAF368_00230 [Planctomycetota bacterium]